jgi:hypothetical protein
VKLPDFPAHFASPFAVTSCSPTIRP